MACAALQCTADCLQSEEDRQAVFACNLVAAEPFWGGLLQVALHVHLAHALHVRSLPPGCPAGCKLASLLRLEVLVGLCRGLHCHLE